MILRAFVLFEFGVAFWLPAMFLFYGVFFGWYTIYAGLVMGDYLGSAAALFCLVGGLLGFRIASQLLVTFLRPEISILGLRAMLIQLSVGILALALFFPVASDVLPAPFLPFLVLPIPVVGHLAYLNRRFVWSAPD